MNRKTLLTTAGIIICVLLGAVIQQQNLKAVDIAQLPQPEQPELSPASPEQTMSVEQQLVASNNKFAFNLYQQILQQDSEKNVFISPSSIAMALDMLYNGASGATQQEMAQALELLDMTPEEVNRANLALQEALENADSQVQLTIANSLWSRKGFPFKRQFLETNQKYYDAEVTELDFAAPGAVGTINNWVSDNTKGKIKRIIDSLRPDDLMFLINAIYFKGNWQQQFDPANTSEQTFYLADGSTKQHALMSRRGEYAYYENDSFQAVSLPYGEGRLSMYIFLPRSQSNLAAFQEQLTTQNWEEWLKFFSRRSGVVELPRFKLEYEVGLNEALMALGMESMFNPSQADFSAMSDGKVVVDAVKHKTFVEVNEEGTEAAAVTSVGIRMTSLEPPPFQMRVDRPFFSVIRDNETGTLLFMGSIVEPK